MFESIIKKELYKYKLAERIIFYFTALIAFITILLSQKLYSTYFGKASLAYALTSLAMIALLRVLKFWGPKD